MSILGGIIRSVLWLLIYQRYDVNLGDKYEWTPGDGVLTSASWAKERTLVLGQISLSGSSLIVLELGRNFGDSKAKATLVSTSHSFRVTAIKSMNAEPTTIYCWTESSPVQPATELGDISSEVLCCVGTLEPAIYVFAIHQEIIEEVYTEPLGKLLKARAANWSNSDRSERPCYAA